MTRHTIKITKKNGRNQLYILELDDGTIHLVHEETIVMERLASGNEIEFDCLKQILARDEVRRCTNQAWMILTKRTTNTAHLIKTLKKKNFTLSSIESAISYLIEKGYVNDREWMKQFVREKTSQGEGPRLIESRLRQRGLDRDLIREVMGELKEDDGLEREMALDALMRWSRRPQSGRQKNKMAAAANWLVRRGFDPSLSWEIVREYQQAGCLDDLDPDDNQSGEMME